MAPRGNTPLPPIRKKLGQHFLSDRRILTRIVDVLDPEPTETIIEIGPGRGALTDILRPRCARLIAVEYDRALAALLRERYAQDKTVEIVEADVLQLSLGKLAGGPYSLIGNVPYYITTPILFHALQPPRADRAVFLVQREVANRMSAAAGDDDYGALTVNLQVLATAKTLFRVPAGAFSPPPKVESAVVKVIPRDQALIRAEEEQPFREFVQSAFGFRRKQMRRVVRELVQAALGVKRKPTRLVRELEPITAEQADILLLGAGIAPDVRPETLKAAQFVELFRVISTRTP